MESTLADEAGATAAPAPAPTEAGAGTGRRKTLYEQAIDEVKYQAEVLGDAIAEMKEHKGYIKPEISRRHGAGRIIMGMSSKYLMLTFQILCILFFIVAITLYAIAYASCWAFISLITICITLNGISRIR